MTTATENSESHNVNHIWERFNLQWIVTGLIAGLGAGLVLLVVGSILASRNLGEWSQSIKLLGAGAYGPESLGFGPIGMVGIYGLTIHLFLSGLYGMTFAQLVDERSQKSSIFILAIVTSLVIWVFGGCLFGPTFNKTLTSTVGPLNMLYFHILFGVSFGLILPVVRDKRALKI